METNIRVDIYKIGGGVIDSAKAFQQVTESISAMKSKYPNDRLVRIFVISAFGETTKEIQGVIDLIDQKAPLVTINKKVEAIKEYLKSIANQADGTKSQQMAQMFLTGGLGSKSRSFANQVNIAANSTLPISDLQKAELLQYGELISYQAVADKVFELTKSPNLRSADARWFIKTISDHPLDAKVDQALTQAFLEPLPFQIADANDSILIMPGFVASATTDNAPTLLGLEGSDYTAAIVARSAFNVGCYKNVSLTYIKKSPGISMDFKGDDAVSIFEKSVTWEQVAEKVSRGEKVLHRKVVETLEGLPIDIRVTNLDYLKDYDSPATIITS